MKLLLESTFLVSKTRIKLRGMAIKKLHSILENRALFNHHFVERAKMFHTSFCSSPRFDGKCVHNHKRTKFNAQCCSQMTFFQNQLGWVCVLLPLSAYPVDHAGTLMKISRDFPTNIKITWNWLWKTQKFDCYTVHGANQPIKIIALNQGDAWMNQTQFLISNEQLKKLPDCLQD